MTTSADFDQGDFVRALRDSELPPPNGLELCHGVPPERRFAIYRNNLCVGLIDALSERFPVCRRLVGDEFFRAMARCHMRDVLPRTPTLFEYGDEFATFVSTFEPAQELPYLSDVARLEYAVGLAYHAADVAPAPLESMRALPLDRLEGATATLHPSTYVIASKYPIVSIWRRHMSEKEATPLELSQGEDALIVRPALEIGVSTLPLGGAAFVEALKNGSTFGDAMNAAAGATMDFNLAACLSALLGAEAFVSINIPP